MGPEIINDVPTIAEAFRDLGGWGVAVIFMALTIWLLRVIFKLQDHVLKLSTTLSATNSKTVASLDAVSSKMQRLEDSVDELGSVDDMKEMKGSLHKINERLIELCTQARGGGS